MKKYLLRYRLIIFILAICLVSLLISSGVSAGQRLDKTGSLSGPYSSYIPLIKVPNLSIFGTSLTQSIPNDELVNVASAGFAWTRLGLDWDAIEPAYGVFDWSKASVLEQSILAVKQSQIQPILLLNTSPVWALKPGFSCGAIREMYFQEFANFAKEAARRYSASPYNVKFIELYNEPDAAGQLGCWGDQSDTSYYGGDYYGQMLKIVYPAIKSANPSLQVLVGGLLMDCDPVNPPDDPARPGQKKDCTPGYFFEGILKSGAGNSFDGVSFHSYDYYESLGQYGNSNWHSSRVLSGSSTLPKAAYLRSVMQKYGIAARPLFNTEYALFCGSENSNTCSAFQNDLEATKAYYIVQFMASSLADGYQAALWYSTLGGRNNSLFNPDWTPLPAYNAYKFANQKIGNAKYNLQVIDPAFVIHELKKASGKIWIVWTKDNASHTLTLPSGLKNIYQIGIDGNGITLPSTESITLDTAPAIIEFLQ